VETGYAQGMSLPTPPGITPTTAEQDQQHYDDEDGRGSHEGFLLCSEIPVGRSATKGCTNDTLYQPRILSHERLMDFRIRDGIRVRVIPSSTLDRRRGATPHCPPGAAYLNWGILGNTRHVMKWTGMYLLGYGVLMVGLLAALWKMGVLASIGAIWTLIGIVIAIGLGIMIAVSHSGSTGNIEIDQK
jgi:hypothetical protein